LSNAARSIAGTFVAARQAGGALPDFPGPVPASLAEAYRIQDEAIALWPDEVAGWKIGRVPPQQVEALGAERLTGPIFLTLLWRADGAEVEIPVFDNGFAAVEAEYVLRIGKDVPPEDTAWTRPDAEALIAAMHVGVETAGSPLATINDLGATVVVSDFGNNHGLILGPEIANWRAELARGLHCETFVDDQRVGVGDVRTGPDDPVGALVFLLEHLARRGRTLKAGQLVSTGAVTGVHDIRIGQHARVGFNGAGDILCAAVKAMPNTRGFA
jgi:2-keto-4-pentenoate hydratase